MFSLESSLRIITAVFKPRRQVLVATPLIDHLHAQQKTSENSLGASLFWKLKGFFSMPKC